MCSVLTHPVVPVALSVAIPQQTLSPTLVVVAAVCSVIPDLDVIGFKVGIRYNDMLGHRGFSHSIFFAAVLAASLTFTLFRGSQGSHWVIFPFLFLSTLSHSILDMLTNGGLGVALFAPFSNQRYFFPWRPAEVSPIGVDRFFSEWGLRVIASELRLVWLPSAAVYIIGQIVRRYG
jgi:inner membrane protein